MILVRFSRTFRERAPEWVLAFILWGWGATLLLPGDSFNRPFFRPLREIAPELTWGAVTFAIGTCRLAALYINGSRSETPRVRQFASFFAMLVWAFLTAGAMGVEWRSPAVFTYGGLFALEAIMFSYSGADAHRVASGTYGHGRI